MKKYTRDLANWADTESEIETATISVLHFGTREQMKITSMFVRDNESDDRANFSHICSFENWNLPKIIAAPKRWSEYRE